MNQAYNNTVPPSFNLMVTNRSSMGPTWAFTEAPVTVVWDAAKKIATLTFTADTFYQFVSGQEYDVALVSTSAIGMSGVKPSLPGTFYIKAQ